MSRAAPGIPAALLPSFFAVRGGWMLLGRRQIVSGKPSRAAGTAGGAPSSPGGARGEEGGRRASGSRKEEIEERLKRSRGDAGETGHWCEALSRARPSPFLPLHNPRAPRKAGGGTPLPQSFYRRPLPSRLVSFTSAQGKALLAGALAGGGGGSFFEVMNQFEMQAEPVSCGLASLAIALNTLELSSWRASQESTRQRPVTEAEILSDLVPEELRVPFMKDGISLSEISMVASKVPGLSVKPLPSDQEDSERLFRRELEAAMSGPSSEAAGHSILLVNFSRLVFGQTGVGHFSPVAAYHRGDDSALVLDTARFKYPAFWVGVGELWRSCSTIDRDTKMARGSITLSRSPQQGSVKSC